MIPRLTLSVLFVACAVLASRGGEAQAQPQPPRIGLLSIGTDPDRPTNWEPFFEDSRCRRRSPCGPIG